MIFCHKCGSEQLEGSEFCYKCGARLATDSVVNNASSNQTNNSARNKLEEYRQKLKNRPQNNSAALAKSKFYSTIIVIVVIVVVIAVIIGGCYLGYKLLTHVSSKADQAISELDDTWNDINKSYNYSTSNSEKAEFEWVDDYSMKREYLYGSLMGGKVVGSIKNISGTDYSLVTITFNLYDSNGNQIDTAVDTINSLKSGNTWRFEASFFDNKAVRAEFDSIKAY